MMGHLYSSESFKHYAKRKERKTDKEKHITIPTIMPMTHAFSNVMTTEIWLVGLLLSTSPEATVQCEPLCLMQSGKGEKKRRLKLQSCI